MAEFFITNTGEDIIRRQLDLRLPQGTAYTLVRTSDLTDSYTLTINGLNQAQTNVVNRLITDLFGSFTTNDTRNSNARKLALLLNDEAWALSSTDFKCDILRYWIKNVLQY